MLAEIRSLDTSRHTLRRFGIVVGGVLIAIGAIVAWRAGSVSATGPSILLGSGSVLVVAGAVLPSALRWIYVAWMTLAIALGFVMTRVILTVVYLILVTPIGLILRAFGQDPMQRRPDPSADTYWIPRDADDGARERLTKYY